MSKGLKIVTIGGGSSYTPELIEGFIKRSKELPIKEIHLVDIEEGKEKLEIIGNLSKRMIKKAGLDWKVHTSLDRKSALVGADFVTTQFRVGGLESRYLDESIPFYYGALGQETNGAGGIFKALRTIPVILDIVEEIKELCPNAWLVNFTNPAGMVTEAAINYGDFEKVVGLCNVPISHIKKESKYLDKKEDELYFQFAGINHFHWHKVYGEDGRDLTEKVIDLIFEKNEKVLENITNIQFMKEQVSNLGLLPCGYHKYYYMEDDLLQQGIDDYKNNKTRAQVVMDVEEKLFKLYKNPKLDKKPEELSDRGGKYYSDAACELISSIYNDKRNIMVVNTKNKGAIRELDYDSIVEVSSVITSGGPIPLAFPKLPAGAKGHLQLMKAMEELTIDAAINLDYSSLLQAFTLNPLIPGGKKAKKMMDEMLEANRKYLKEFH